MASPQLNKGYTRIANEILNIIMQVNLNGTQFRLVMAIWRLTYGFNRKEREMSVTLLSNTINASRSQVARELNALINRKIILSTGTGVKGASVLMFNKNYEEWQENEDKRTGSLVEEKPKKQPKKKASVKKYEDDNTYYKMAVYFLDKVKVVAKDAGVEHLIAKANLQTWSDDFRKLIELDGVDKRKAKEVMDWVTQDSFWRINVLSARKLRDKFPDLAIKMSATSSKQQSTQKKPPIDSRDKDIEFQKFIAAGGDPNDFDWNS